MVQQLRTTWVAAFALALLVAALVAAVSPRPTAVLAATEGDSTGICVHLRPLNPTDEYCLWLSRQA